MESPLIDDLAREWAGMQNTAANVPNTLATSSSTAVASPTKAQPTAVLLNVRKHLPLIIITVGVIAVGMFLGIKFWRQRTNRRHQDDEEELMAKDVSPSKAKAKSRTQRIQSVEELPPLVPIVEESSDDSAASGEEEEEENSDEPLGVKMSPGDIFNNLVVDKIVE